MSAAGKDLVSRNEKNLCACKNSWTTIFAEFGKLCIPFTTSFFANTDINFIYMLARALWKINFCNACINYYSINLLIFIILCQCKECVLFVSLMFHNKLANFASAVLLLIATIDFAQVVLQLLKPHLMALLHLTSCLLRWSCAWVKMLSRITVRKLHALRINLIWNQMHP